MAIYRTIKLTFWNDPFTESLPALEKLLYLYLFTSSHTNNLGVLEITRKKISSETGIPEEDVNKMIIKLTEQHKLITDGYKILVLNFIKNQTDISPNVIKGLTNLYTKEKSNFIKRALFDENKHVFKKMEVPQADTVSAKPLPSPLKPLQTYEVELEVEDELEEELKHMSVLTSETKKPKQLVKIKEYTDDFEIFWKAYPNGNKGKKRAFQNYEICLTGKDRMQKATTEQLLRAAKRYKEEVADREQKYIMHASRFLGTSEEWIGYDKPSISVGGRVKRDDIDENDFKDEKGKTDWKLIYLAQQGIIEYTVGTKPVQGPKKEWVKA